ncbi:MAG: hypothetical protein QM756_02680 [Polyangiaceae bacterium]
MSKALPNLVRALLLGPVLVLGASTCLPARPAPDGECKVDTEAVIDCRGKDFANQLVEAGLVPYSCSGTVRPDQNPKYREGVPSGILCADKGLIAGTDRQGYCCTSDPVDCVYEPASECEDPTVKVQCRYGNRPESLNSALSCTNGLWEKDLTTFCCSGQRPKSPCVQTDTAGCPKSVLGFYCTGDTLPTGEDLGPNKSRADYFHPACSIPKPNPNNPDGNYYCCFMPAPTPVGGTCVNYPTLPNCAEGRYGFACYGADRPEEDNLPMNCDAGVVGTSAEGYKATTYCCDFSLTSVAQ